MRGKITVAGLLALGITGAAACGSTSTVTRTLPGPTVTVTATQVMPGPTVTATHNVPGPAVTRTATVTVSAPPPGPGATIGTWSGSGNQATPAFNVPASGDYTITWSYYGNTDPSMGGATNFSISENGSGLGGDLPNDIATSGSGSTEVTGASGTGSFNVQAAGHWTITVKAAP